MHVSVCINKCSVLYQEAYFVINRRIIIVNRLVKCLQTLSAYLLSIKNVFTVAGGQSQAFFIRKMFVKTLAAVFIALSFCINISQCRDMADEIIIRFYLG